MSKLTAIAVEKARSDGNRREIPDGLLRGLYLIVQPSGMRSWAVRYRSPVDQRTRKYTIGKYPAIDLATARELGSLALRAVAEGRDPGAEKIHARVEARRGNGAAATVSQHFDKFLERHAKRNTRESSWKEAERLFRKEIEPSWASRSLATIRKADVIELLDSIVDRGAPVLANRVFALIRKFFNWCVERDQLQHSPCQGVRAPALEKSRERTLSDEELRIIWSECEKLKFPFGPLFQLLILTGQRVGEVAGMSKKELSPDTWTISSARAKNGRQHVVPLSSMALKVISELPMVDPQKNKKELIFTSKGETPVSGEAKAKARVAVVLKERLEDAEPWTLHDIRRTVASGLQRLGFSVEVVEAVLNHKSGTVRGVAAIYARHDYAREKRDALAAWGQHVERVVSGRSNVVPFALNG
jgi:integrase